MKITNKINKVKLFSEILIGDVFIDMEQDGFAVYMKTNDLCKNAVNMKNGTLAKFDAEDNCQLVEAELILSDRR